MLRQNKQEIKSTIQTNKITINEWQTYFDNLYKGREDNAQPMFEEEDEPNITINPEQITNLLKQLKNLKSSGSDNVTNEMLKYRGGQLNQKLAELFTNILNRRKILEKILLMDFRD